MSKTSRMLAVPQWIFTLINLPMMLMWFYAFGRRGSFNGAVMILVCFFAMIYALVKAMTAYCDATGYRVVQSALCLGHLAGLIFLLMGMPLLPGLEAFLNIAEHGITLFSLFWLATDLGPLGHLMALMVGLIPLILPLHPKVRQLL